MSPRFAAPWRERLPPALDRLSFSSCVSNRGAANGQVSVQVSSELFFLVLIFFFEGGSPFQEETMKGLHVTLAAAALAIGFMASATAMPVDKLDATKTETMQAEQARLVCNRWGRCWHTHGWGYRAYGYYPRRHWRHHW